MLNNRQVKAIKTERDLNFLWFGGVNSMAWMMLLCSHHDISLNIDNSTVRCM